MNYWLQASEGRLGPNYWSWVITVMMKYNHFTVQILQLHPN